MKPKTKNGDWWAPEITLLYPEALFDEENGQGTFYEGQALLTRGTGTDLKTGPRNLLAYLPAQVIAQSLHPKACHN